MKIKLNHHCHMKDVVGGPGDVIECDARVGKIIIDRGGATEVAKEPPAEVRTPAPEADVETATRPASEAAVSRRGNLKRKKEY